MELPHYSSTTIDGRRVTVDGLIPTQPDGITLDSSNTDAGSTPTHRFRKGNVVVYKTSAQRYVEANDATGDRGTAPAKTSTGHTDGNGVIEVVSSLGTFSVTTSTGSGSEANNATDLNANAPFAAHFVASSGGGELTITMREPGRNAWFYIGANTRDGCGFTEGEANGVSGEDADYRVTCQDADLKDEEGTAIHATCLALRTGHFYVPNLINLTPEARAVLRSRGAKFSDE